MFCIKESFTQNWHIFWWATLPCQGQANNEWMTRNWLQIALPSPYSRIQITVRRASLFNWLKQRKKLVWPNLNHFTTCSLNSLVSLRNGCAIFLCYLVYWSQIEPFEVDQYVNANTILLETHPFPGGTLNVGQPNTNLVNLGQ